MQFPQTTGVDHEKQVSDAPLPDPEDRDPNYSDDLLWQEYDSDASFITSEFNQGIHLSTADDLGGVGRFSIVSGMRSSAFNQGCRINPHATLAFCQLMLKKSSTKTVSFDCV